MTICSEPCTPMKEVPLTLSYSLPLYFFSVSQSLSAAHRIFVAQKHTHTLDFIVVQHQDMQPRVGDGLAAHARCGLRQRPQLGRWHWGTGHSCCSEVPSVPDRTFHQMQCAGHRRVEEEEPVWRRCSHCDSEALAVAAMHSSQGQSWYHCQCAGAGELYVQVGHLLTKSNNDRRY